jgi:FkbM family methyltransferase
MKRIKKLFAKIYHFLLPAVISRKYLTFRIFFNKNDSLIREIAKSNLKIYEEKETQLLIDLLKNRTQPTIIDVGANIGLMSLNLYHFFPEAKIFSFEPGPFQYSLLKKNIHYNQLSNSIKIFNMAVSESSGEMEFHVHGPGDSSGDGFIDTGRAGESKIIKVKTVSLDEWWTNRQKHTVDLLKIDTEGAELQVLKGSKNLIETCKPIILIEICYLNYQKYDHNFKDYILLLEEMGYLLYDLTRTNTITTSNFDMFKDQFYYLTLPKGF